MKITTYTQASTLWLEYEQALKNYILKKVKDVDASNEIAQEVLMKVYNACCSEREIIKINSWLFQIAHNAVVDYWQKKKKLTNEVPEVSHLAEDNVWDDLVEYVEPLIKLLPEMYAIPLHLSDIDGIKQVEIAKQLNIGLSAAKSRIQRGRALLQKEIQTCCIMEKDVNGRLSGISVKESCKPLQEHVKKKE